MSMFSADPELGPRPSDLAPLVQSPGASMRTGLVDNQALYVRGGRPSGAALDAERAYYRSWSERMRHAAALVREQRRGWK